MAVKTKKCDVCGELFLTYRENVKYCCDDCRQEGYRRRAMERDASKKAKKEAMSTLAETNQAARDAGMSYGKYVGLQWLKEHKW